MRKNELDKINDKMGLIEETLKDEVPKISMPIFSYEAKEERHAKEKRALMKIIVFLVTVIFILAIVDGFLVYLNQYDFSVNDTTIEALQSGKNCIADEALRRKMDLRDSQKICYVEKYC